MGAILVVAKTRLSETMAANANVPIKSIRLSTFLLIKKFKAEESTLNMIQQL